MSRHSGRDQRKSHSKDRSHKSIGGAQAFADDLLHPRRGIDNIANDYAACSYYAATV